MGSEGPDQQKEKKTPELGLADLPEEKERRVSFQSEGRRRKKRRGRKKKREMARMMGKGKKKKVFLFPAQGITGSFLLWGKGKERGMPRSEIRFRKGRKEKKAHV